MPIIPKHKAIFIHIPKTAGTSIEKVLIDYKLRISGDKAKWWGTMKTQNGKYELDHSTIKYMVQNCKEYKKDFLSFCVVRNPYERLVSEYNMCKRYKSRFVENISSFKEFVFWLKKNFKAVLDNEEKNHFLVCHYLPQYKFTHIDNKCQINFVMRFENLQEDWKKLCDLLKINKKLIHCDQYSSQKKYNYEDYYTPELKEIVYEMYKQDFIEFNYEK